MQPYTTIGCASPSTVSISRAMPSFSATLRDGAFSGLMIAVTWPAANGPSARSRHAFAASGDITGTLVRGGDVVSDLEHGRAVDFLPGQTAVAHEQPCHVVEVVIHHLLEGEAFRRSRAHVASL